MDCDGLSQLVTACCVGWHMVIFMTAAGNSEGENHVLVVMLAAQWATVLDDCMLQLVVPCGDGTIM